MADETYHCPDCTATFDDPVALGAHAVIAHPDDVVPLG